LFGIRWIGAGPLAGPPVSGSGRLPVGARGWAAPPPRAGSPAGGRPAARPTGCQPCGALPAVRHVRAGRAADNIRDGVARPPL